MLKKSLIFCVALALTAASLQPAIATPGDGSDSAKPCLATKAMNQKALGKFYAYVINVDTGEVLVDVRGKETTPSASVMKVLTANAALQNIPENYRATTELLQVPSEPGTLVLKGGGDFTLSRLVPGESSVYSKSPRLRSLIKQATAALSQGTPITKIILDSNFFQGPSWNPDWPLSYRTLGYVSLITAIQTDGDRVQPNRLVRSYNFRRTKDPIITAGKALREQLGELAQGAELVVGETPQDAIVIAQVQSQEMREKWLPHMLTYSDNTAAEFIALHAAKAAGLEPNLTGSQTILRQSLRAIGLRPKGFVFRDASGLSDSNRVQPKLLAEFMVKVAKAEYGLEKLLEWMPVAGESGTLRYRFQGSSSVARSKVIAKTGYIPGLYGLSGIVFAEDGAKLAFAVFARADAETGVRVTYTAQGAIDRVVTRFYRCGASLGQ
ncbi:MAG: D-alanyl-D-alanine carboxypeptidase/D-alanyl-D-alanine-endopeptidase [Actinomycetota bacterium]